VRARALSERLPPAPERFPPESAQAPDPLPGGSAGGAPSAADLAWVAFGLALLLAWDAGGLDLPVARLFGDGSGFALRDHWLLRGVLHDGARWVGWGIVALLLVNLRRPLVSALTARERLGWVLLTLAGAALVPLVKQTSLTSCPWDLAEFGGHALYVSHWRPGIADGGGGHCFPSGHASTSFALLSGWFVLRRAHPRAARRWLAAVLAAGTLLGLVQLARGAHYPSHTLWTGWLCYTLGVLAAPWLADSSQRRASASAAGSRERAAAVSCAPSSNAVPAIASTEAGGGGSPHTRR
jgi:membrane-associated PAP2 superfamily phosphatase